MKKAGEPGESPLLFFAAAIVIGRCAAVRAENAGGEADAADFHQHGGSGREYRLRSFTVNRAGFAPLIPFDGAAEVRPFTPFPRILPKETAWAVPSRAVSALKTGASQSGTLPETRT